MLKLSVQKELHIQMNLNVYLLLKMKMENFQEKYLKKWF